VTNVQRFPLQWPVGWKRTPAASRKPARFGVRRSSVPGGWGAKHWLSVADALARLQSELRMLGAAAEVLSTNVVLRLDGLPRSGQGEPVDPGAAVYFGLKGKPRCLACDRWTRVADNIAAIAAHVEAIRAVDRYGVGTMEQAFAGYAQLQAGPTDWRSVLGLGHYSVTMDDVDAAFKRLARIAHPDAGGTDAEMARLNQAREIARAELGGAV
jgi:hypothetical protein